jgi:single-strand DNA-binding protein
MVIMLQTQAVGRLVRDPDLKYTNNGTPVCNFTIACDRPYTNSNGERDTDFIRIVTWRKSAENNSEYLEKGRLISVSGRLQINDREGDNGKTYRNVEIHANNVEYLDFGNDENNNNSENNSEIDDPEDDFDVPF